MNKLQAIFSSKCTNKWLQCYDQWTKDFWSACKVKIGQVDDCTTSCLLDYPYFKENYMLIAIDLSKQKALDAYPKATERINFTVNLAWDGSTTMFFIIEEVKETFLDFSQGKLRHFRLF